MPKPEYEEAPAHFVQGDLQPYKNMVNDGRAQHREFLKQHNLIEVGNETKYLQPKPKSIPPGLKQRIVEIAAEKLRYK